MVAMSLMLLGAAAIVLGAFLISVPSGIVALGAVALMAGGDLTR